jgi:hypothetical protein
METTDMFILPVSAKDTSKIKSTLNRSLSKKGRCQRMSGGEIMEGEGSSRGRYMCSTADIQLLYAIERKRF